MIWDLISVLLITTGCVFFLAGSVGMLRFPDVLTRLHATTKADNLGLGFVLLGLVLLVEWEGFASVLYFAKLLLVWMLVLASSATACHLIARAVLRAQHARGDRLP